jgi:hypothetical protein
VLLFYFCATASLRASLTRLISKFPEKGSRTTDVTENEDETCGDIYTVSVFITITLVSVSFGYNGNNFTLGSGKLFMRDIAYIFFLIMLVIITIRRSHLRKINSLVSYYSYHMPSHFLRQVFQMSYIRRISHHINIVYNFNAYYIFINISISISVFDAELQGLTYPLHVSRATHTFELD